MAAAPASPSPGRPIAGATATPRATATPSATQTTRPTPIVVAGARPVPVAGEIEPGRYFIPKGRWTPATFSFTMPAGWAAENSGQTISKHANESGREVGWGVAIVDRLFADPCGANDTIEVGPTADDLVRALLALPGVEASGPFEVTIGALVEHPHLDVTDPVDAGSGAIPAGTWS
jgi:hypothetical protein